MVKQHAIAPRTLQASGIERKGINMIKDQRGGMLSNIFLIPVGTVLMVGFFFLGYYVGKYQSNSRVSEEIAQPLPEMSSSAETKQEEFTFYKTLADKNDKTVSIDLRAKSANEENKPEKLQAETETPRKTSAQSLSKEKRIETKVEQEAPSPVKSKQAASKQPPKKKEIATITGGKIRYTVQIASYQEKEMAEEEAKRLKKRGYAAFVVSSEIPGKGRWYRVRLGSFLNKASAENLQKTIQSKEGISPIILSE